MLVCLSVCLSVCTSVCLFDCLSLYVCLFVCPYAISCCFDWRINAYKLFMSLAAPAWHKSYFETLYFNTNTFTGHRQLPCMWPSHVLPYRLCSTHRHRLRRESTPFHYMAQCRSVHRPDDTPWRAHRRMTLTTPSQSQQQQQQQQQSPSGGGQLLPLAWRSHRDGSSRRWQTITPRATTLKSRAPSATTPMGPRPSNLLPGRAPGSACRDEARCDRRTFTRSKVTSSCRGFSSSRRSAATVKTSSGRSTFTWLQI